MAQPVPAPRIVNPPKRRPKPIHRRRFLQNKESNNRIPQTNRRNP
jgi:hypothetical protein